MSSRSSDRHNSGFLRSSLLGWASGGNFDERPEFIAPEKGEQRLCDLLATFETFLNSEGNRDSHERGGYEGADVLTLVLRFGQRHKLVVKLCRLPVFLSRFNSVHGRSIECFE